MGALESLVRAGRMMLPHCSKKAEDLAIMVEYLEDRTTGDQAIERLNKEVNSGRRSGYVRCVNLPLTRVEGARLAQLENARKAGEAHAVDVPQAVQDGIRKDHSDRRLCHILLSRKHGYLVSVVRRVLGER